MSDAFDAAAAEGVEQLGRSLSLVLVAGPPRFAAADGRVDLAAGELAILDRDGIVPKGRRSSKPKVARTRRWAGVDGTTTGGG
jgi:hypothetical protein